MQLIGLPDIGDPFDLAEFHASTVPEERNAFVLYDRSAAVLKPLAGYLEKSGQSSTSSIGGRRRRRRFAGGPKRTARR